MNVEKNQEVDTEQQQQQQPLLNGSSVSSSSVPEQRDHQFFTEIATAAVFVAAVWGICFFMLNAMHALSYVWRPLGTVGCVMLQQQLDRSHQWKGRLCVQRVVRILDQDRFTIPWLLFGFLVVVLVVVPERHDPNSFAEIGCVIFLAVYSLSLVWIASRKAYLTSSKIRESPRERESLILSSLLVIGGGCAIWTALWEAHLNLTLIIDVCLFCACLLLCFRSFIWLREQPFYRQAILGEDVSANGHRDSTE